MGGIRSYTLYRVQTRCFSDIRFASVSLPIHLSDRELGSMFVTVLLQPWLSTCDTGATPPGPPCSISAGKSFTSACSSFSFCEMGTSVLICLCEACCGQSTELSLSYLKEYILSQAFQWDLLPGHVFVSCMGHVLTEIVTIT